MDNFQAEVDFLSTIRTFVSQGGVTEAKELIKTHTTRLEITLFRKVRKKDSYNLEYKLGEDNYEELLHINII